MTWTALARLAAVVLALAGTASAAHAHAQLVRSMPDEGAVVAAPPPVLALHFNEPVRPATVRLLGPDGAQVDAQVRAGGLTVEVAPAAPLAQGGHVLAYRVVSADGHPVAGALSFSVGAPARGAAQPAAGDGESGAAAAALVARALAYAGSLFGIGGALALAWLGAAAPAAASAARRAARAALAAGAAGYGASLLLLGRELADGWSGAPAAAASTSFALSAGIWCVAALVALAALSLKGSRARIAALAATLGAGLALATTGHTATAPPRWLSSPALALHAIAAMAWAGALPLIALAAARRDDGLSALLRRISGPAILSVALLAAAGAVLAGLQLRTPADLWQTAYGRVLCAKLALVVLLLALAGWNRLALTPAVAAPGQPERGRRAAGRLGGSVIAEIGLMLVLAGVIALWRFTPPPRALAPADPPQRQVHMHGEQAMVDVILAPGRAGVPGRLTVVPMQTDFTPLAAREIVVVFSRPADRIEGLERKLAPTPEGPWTSPEVTLPLAGRWTVRVELLVSDFDKIGLEGEIDIAPAAAR